MDKNTPIITLWIQNAPETYQTILSFNGIALQAGSSKYIKYFEKLTSEDLHKYTELTSTVKRLIVRKGLGIKQNFDSTYLSGHFVQTDKSDRQICYRALIIDAKSNEEVCSLLEKEAQLYGCSISEKDKLALKKKSNNSALIIILIILVILICIWIFNS